MAGNKEKEYKTQKRKQKRIKKRPGPDKIFVCNDTLMAIYIDTYEATLSGTITFKTKNNKEIKRTLLYTWLPQGIWKFKILKGIDGRPGFRHAELINSKNIDKALENRVKKLNAGGNFVYFSWLNMDNKDFDPIINCLWASAIDKEISVTVTYFHHGTKGKGEKLTPEPFSDDYLPLLKVEMVARILVALLEHFAGLNIDDRIPLGGISQREYKKLIGLKSKDPKLDVKTIIRIVCRGTFEYYQVRKNELDHNKRWSNLLLMLETILYQFKCGHPWARANLLEIGIGFSRDANYQVVKNIGIKRRGGTMLLYDENGTPIPAFVGFQDIHYRNIDLDKVKAIKVSIDDPALGDFMKVLEQTFAFPTRETYAFLAGVDKFYYEITLEIYRIYGGEIEKKIMKMLPTALGFFVVNAVVGVLARRGNPYAAALLVAFKALGWVMGVDMGIAMAQKMQEAGLHFIKMETLHRRNPKEKGKKKLTDLSRYHLYLGTKALIDAMAELIAMGVFWAGFKLGVKAGKGLAKRIRFVSRQEATLEVFIKDGKIEKIRALKGKKVIEVESAIPEGKGKKAIDSPPLEESGPNAGRRQLTAEPQRGQIIRIEDFPFRDYVRARAGQPLPKSLEQTSGMLNEHLKIAIDIARKEGYMVLFRTTNPQGLDLIRMGYPPKPKTLIDVNTHQETGKVTASEQTLTKGKNAGKTQIQAAHDAGYYTLDSNGYAYRVSGGRKIFLRGEAGAKLPEGCKVTSDGRLQYDMSYKRGGKQFFREGEVIEPSSKKSIVGDYDLQDVISAGAPQRNMALAASGGKIMADFQSPEVQRFMSQFNHQLGSTARIVHGADAQFLTYRQYRNSPFKGPAIGITPNGDVVYFTEAELARFYRQIGRSRLDASIQAPRPRLRPDQIGKGKHLKPVK